MGCKGCYKFLKFSRCLANVWKSENIDFVFDVISQATIKDFQEMEGRSTGLDSVEVCLKRLKDLSFTNIIPEMLYITALYFYVL